MNERERRKHKQEGTNTERKTGETNKGNQAGGTGAQGTERKRTKRR